MDIYRFAAQYNLNMLSDSDLEELQRQSDAGATDREIEQRAVNWDQDIRAEKEYESPRGEIPGFSHACGYHD